MHDTTPLFSRTSRAALALAVLFLSMLLSPEVSRAQLRTEDVYFNGGTLASIPLFPDGFSDRYSIGFGIKGGVGLQITGSSRLQLDGSLTRYGYDQPGVVGDAVVEDAVEGGLLRRSLTLRYSNLLNPDAESIQFSLVLGTGWDAYAISGLEGDVTPPANPADLLPSPAGQSMFAVEGGFELAFPVSYMSAFYIEPTWRTSFPTGDLIHQIGFSAGFVFGEF